MSPPRPPVRHRSVAVGLLLAVLVAGLAACSSTTTTEPDGASDPTTSPGTPVKTPKVSNYPMAIVLGKDVTSLDEQPQRIVSLSPAITEMLFAVGAGDQVVAVDAGSTHPSGAPVTDLTEAAPDPDAIAGYDPDLVLLSQDPGGVADQLEAKGIPTVVLATPTTPEGVTDQIRLLGRAAGHEDGAAAVGKVLYDDVQAVIDGKVATLGPAIATTFGPTVHTLLRGFVEEPTQP